MQPVISDKLHRLATCWKIVRTDGDELYFTDHDVSLKLSDGNIYIPNGGFSASARQGQQGLKDNNFEVKGVIDSDHISFEDLRAGKYREAEVTEYLVDWSAPASPPIDTHRHWIAQTTFNGQAWVAQITGQSFWLNRPVGRTYTRECGHDLGGPGCDVDLEPFTVTGAVTSIHSQRKSFVTDVVAGTFPSGDPIVDGVFDDSNITWLTGRNANYGKSQVKTYFDDGGFTLQLFSAKDIAVGDTFSVYRTCRKITEDCKGIYDNFVNFGGFPFIPGTDRYLGVASSQT